MSSFDEQYKKALAAAGDSTSAGSGSYYAAERESSGLFHIYAADPHAKQLFWGWASDGTRYIWRYGSEWKGASKNVRGARHRHPDYKIWSWTCTTGQAAELLRDLLSQKPEPEEKAAYAELTRLLKQISEGKLPSRSGAKKGGSVEKEIIDGMAKLAWSMHWADRQEERGRSFSGMNIYDLAPKPPKAAKEWAARLAEGIVKQNGKSLAELLAIAEAAGYGEGAESFGNDLAHKALGTGVDWTDRIRGGSRVEIKVPRSEFYI